MIPGLNPSLIPALAHFLGTTGSGSTTETGSMGAKNIGPKFHLFPRDSGKDAGRGHIQNCPRAVERSSRPEGSLEVPEGLKMARSPRAEVYKYHFYPLSTLFKVQFIQKIT